MRMRQVPVLLAAWLGLTSLAHAGTWVVSVGVEGHTDPSINKLLYAAADATAVAHTFRATGIGDDHIQLLVSSAGPSTQPTRANVLTALDRLRTRAEPTDLVVVFFAGHGVEDKGQPYLLLSDTRRAMLEATSLPLTVLRTALEQIPAAQVVLLVDACRNDPDAARADTDARLTDGLARGLQGQAMTAGPKPRAVLTLLACDVGERAWEDPPSGHGIFTARLLEALRATAGTDGTVRLRKVAEMVRTQVTHWAARAGKKQSPTLSGPAEADPVLLVRPAEPLVSIEAANRPLAEVTGELAERARLQIVLGPGVDGRLRVTGSLRGQPVTVALRALTAVYGLKVEQKGEVLVLSRGAGPADAVADDEPAPPPAADGALIVAPRGGHCRSLGDAVAKAPKGGTIRIRPGVYVEAVEVRKPVKIIGDGPRENIVLTSSNGPCLTLRADPVTVSGVTLLQHGLPGETDQSAVSITEGEATLTDCEVVGGAPAGVLVSGAEAKATLERCEVSQAGLGVLVQLQSTAELRTCHVAANTCGLRATAQARVTAANCSLENNSSYGLRCDVGAQATASDCAITGNRDIGAYCERDGRLELTSCQLKGNTRYGVFGTGGGAVTCRGCQVEGGNGAGIATEGTCVCVAEDCTVTGCSTGIGIWSSGTRHAIRRCTVVGNTHRGVALFNGAVVEMTDCKVTGNGIAGDAKTGDVRLEGGARIITGGAQ